VNFHIFQFIVASSSITPNDKIPSITLYNNYPNPFNPNTNIRYDLAKSGTVKLSVFNQNGEIIKTLVDDYQKAGNYSVDFDGKKLSSGLYYYTIELNGSLKMKKMILLK